MDKPHLTLAKSYWQAHLQPHDIAIDATCGNGHDTLFLTELCHTIGLDIQPEAIAKTNIHAPKAILHRLSHAHIDQIPLPYAPRLIVYNLGYLPGGNKSITTQTDSTLDSVQKGLELLAPNGALSITCYPGHDEGLREETALLEWAAALPSSRYQVCHHRWLNRHRSPSLLWIALLP
jgi:SAM-dependent methyltransferase